MIQVISPIALKLGQFKVSILKQVLSLRISEGRLTTPLGLLVGKIEIVLPQAPKEKAASV